MIRMTRIKTRKSDFFNQADRFHSRFMLCSYDIDNGEIHLGLLAIVTP